MLNQLARYDFALPLVFEVSPESVLDVGSGSEGLARFGGRGFQLTVSDIDFSDYGTVEVEPERSEFERVEASVMSLPFADRQFDVVIALDLIEHLSPEDRDTALSEIGRVSRLRAVIGCPAGELALGLDRKLASIYDRLPRRVRPKWLQEHLINGFPEVADLVRPLEPYGAVTVIGNEHAYFHYVVSAIEATPILNRFALSVARVLEPATGSTPDNASQWRSKLLRVLRGRDREPTYRKFAILDRASDAANTVK